MNCRIGCGACCISPSITTFIPGMPNGKRANERCIQLDEKNRCKLFGHNDRPTVCGAFNASADVCGDNQMQALALIARMEVLTSGS